eukprot:3880169-Pyramimonas_sp.AAC.1
MAVVAIEARCDAVFRMPLAFLIRCLLWSAGCRAPPLAIATCTAKVPYAILARPTTNAPRYDVPALVTLEV